MTPDPAASIALPSWRRAVLKVGSNLIAPDGGAPSTRYLLAIAGFICDARDRGREVVLVSSGAVAAGRAQLGGQVPATLAARQALAALGQPKMFELWARLLDRRCAQVLLARDDLENRRRFVNAKNTLRTLLELDAIPVVNENDSVAVDELKLGDNDNLAAHVAVLVDADLLVLLTDIDGLYTANPRLDPTARLIEQVAAVDPAIMALAAGPGSAAGTGGMRTKLEAASKAAARGIPTVIANGRRREVLEALGRDQCRGTLIARSALPVRAKAHWLKHALSASGRVVIDSGAARALSERGASLLAAGVLACEGSFRSGDAVEVWVRDADGERALARGLCQYEAAELKRILGLPSQAIAARLGYPQAEAVIHRDDLVLL